MRLLLAVLLSTILLGWTLKSSADDILASRPLAGYVLTHSEFMDLSLAQKVNYYKFLVDYLATIEEMQERVQPEKTAHLRLQLFNLLPQAFADTYQRDQSLLGKTCIYGMQVSEYEFNSAGYFRCKPVIGGSCTKGQSACGQSFVEVVRYIPAQKNLSAICVKTPAYQERPGLTRRCFDKMSELTGLNLDASIGMQMKAWSMDKQKEYEAFVAGMKKHLNEFQEQHMGSKNLSVTQYCANKNAVNKGKQEEECIAIQKLVSRFEVATTTEEADADEAGMKVLNASTMAEPEDGDNEGPIATETVEEDKTEAIPAAQAKSKDQAPTVEKLDVAQVKTEKKKAKVQTETKPENCNKKYESSLGVLSCVACGLEQAVGAKQSSYNSWVALLGIAAQSSGNYSVRDAASREAYRTRVIDMLASYGYCSNSEYGVDVSGSSDVRDWVDGKDDVNQSFLGVFGTSSKETRKFAKTFGFPKQFLPDYVSSLFPKSDFSGRKDLVTRNARFQANLKGYAATRKKSAFANCARAIQKRSSEKDAFKFICTKSGKAGASAVKANNKLRNTIAKACGVGAKTEKVGKTCGRRVCEPVRGVYANFNNSNPYCGHNNGGNGGGGRTHGGGGNPPGEGKENESNRPDNGNPGGKPGESQNSNNGAGGKGRGQM